MAPWLIAAMDILGSPAQLFSLLYGSLSDLLALPARNLRLALAYARGSASASAAEAALGAGLPHSAAMRGAALLATLSTSGLRVGVEAVYALAAAGRRSASALHKCASLSLARACMRSTSPPCTRAPCPRASTHGAHACRLTASVCPAPFKTTLDPVEAALTLPALSMESCVRAITSRPLWMLPASSIIAAGTVATGALCMPLSIIFGYSEVRPACTHSPPITCMHVAH
jgi:hypothetical protein